MFAFKLKGLWRYFVAANGWMSIGHFSLLCSLQMSTTYHAFSLQNPTVVFKRVYWPVPKLWRLFKRRALLKQSRHCQATVELAKRWNHYKTTQRLRLAKTTTNPLHCRPRKSLIGKPLQTHRKPMETNHFRRKAFEESERKWAEEEAKKKKEEEGNLTVFFLSLCIECFCFFCRIGVRCALFMFF